MKENKNEGQREECRKKMCGLFPTGEMKKEEEEKKNLSLDLSGNNEGGEISLNSKYIMMIELTVLADGLNMREFRKESRMTVRSVVPNTHSEGEHRAKEQFWGRKLRVEVGDIK